jgi:hypothetical protein
VYVRRAPLSCTRLPQLGRREGIHLTVNPVSVAEPDSVLQGVLKYHRHPSNSVWDMGSGPLRGVVSGCNFASWTQTGRVHIEMTEQKHDRRCHRPPVAKRLPPKQFEQGCRRFGQTALSGVRRADPFSHELDGRAGVVPGPGRRKPDPSASTPRSGRACQVACMWPRAETKAHAALGIRFQWPRCCSEQGTKICFQANLPPI